eukprot:jgi/Astpho2/5600/fgenesh1_pg.00079_%23_56_t
MVKHFKVSAELGLPAHVFLLERDSAAFRSLVATVLDLGSLEFEDEWRQDDVSFVRQTTYPQFDKYVPASFAKMAQKYIGPKTKLKSRLIIEEVTKTTCRQTLEGTLDIHVGMGLGGIAESIIASQLAKVYKSIPIVVNKWKVVRQQILKTPEGRAMLLSGRPDVRLDWVSKEAQEYLKGDGPIPATDTATPSSSKGRQSAGDITKSTRQLLVKAQDQLRREQERGNQPGPRTEGLAHPTTTTQAQYQSSAKSPASPVQAERTASLEASSVRTDSLPGSFTMPERASSAELAAAEEPEPFDMEAAMYGQHFAAGAQAAGKDATAETQGHAALNGEAAASPVKPGRDRRRRRQDNFNDSFKHWGNVWTRMGVKGEPGPDQPQRKKQKQPSTFKRIITCGMAAPSSKHADDGGSPQTARV